MATKRRPLWNRDNQLSYWSAKEAAELRASDRQQGQHTARALARVWAGLNARERAVMERLLTSGRNSVVGLYEDELLDGLVSKGLLQVPPGVGTLLMREMETTFTVPSAVWRELTGRKDEFLLGPSEGG
ncbi:MAG: hypothetical protein V3S40_02290 [Kiloniellales bacterium]